jgi:hypothetical protein
MGTQTDFTAEITVVRASIIFRLEEVSSIPV